MPKFIKKPLNPWPTTEEIDQAVLDEKVDDVISMQRVAAYLGLTGSYPFRFVNADFPYLSFFKVGALVAVRISDLRRFLQWRQIVWNAWDAELCVAPLAATLTQEDTKPFTPYVPPYYC